MSHLQDDHDPPIEGCFSGENKDDVGIMMYEL